MPVRPDEPAPYAPPSAVMGVIEGFRDRGFSVPFTKDVLVRAGVSESLVPRTLKSLQQLDLIDEVGNPTPQLEGLKRATTEEFRPRLAEVVKAAYADVFAFTNPATDDEVRIADAFRVYNPVGMRPRMISLFMGLCEFAGIIPVSERPAPSPSPRRSPSAKRVVQGRGTNGAKGTDDRAQEFGGVLHPLITMHPLIAGLLATLPPNGKGWSQEQRDKFIKTIPTVLDFAIPIRDVEPVVAVEDDDQHG